jgi:uncharacterized protein (DUF1778 family)
MGSVETTTIRVRRSTQQRLAREAELAGKSVTAVLEAATDLLEEQRLLAGMARSHEQHADALRAEMAIWDGTLADGLPPEDWSDAIPDED